MRVGPSRGPALKARRRTNNPGSLRPVWRGRRPRATRGSGTERRRCRRDKRPQTERPPPPSPRVVACRPRSARPGDREARRDPNQRGLLTTGSQPTPGRLLVHVEWRARAPRRRLLAPPVRPGDTALRPPPVGRGALAGGPGDFRRAPGPRRARPRGPSPDPRHGAPTAARTSRASAARRRRRRPRPWAARPPPNLPTSARGGERLAGLRGPRAERGEGSRNGGGGAGAGEGARRGGAGGGRRAPLPAPPSLA